jgi:ankyrin repeat protein
VQHGAADIVRYLIEKGADVSAATTEGETALHIACSHNPYNVESPSLSLAETLIDLGADLEAKDGSGATPLFTSVARHHDGYLFDPYGQHVAV